MKRKKMMILIVLFLMMIGFAALTTVLIINGTIKIKNGGTNFLDDVVFTKAETEMGTANITTDGKSMTFTTNELVNTNDEFLLNFEVTNKNKSIDGDVEIECGPTNNEEAFDEYITSVINPNHFELKATTSQEGILKITLNKINFNEDFDIEYSCRIVAYAIGSESYEGDATLVADNGIAKPKIDSDNKLIPVTLADDGTVTKVSQDDSTWYDYRAKRWDNAVILIDSPSQTYQEGDTIKEDDIESYFVWIPKYKYRLWNVDTVESSETSLKHSIDIIFDIDDTDDQEGISCKTPLVSGESGNCNNGEYMTHPAFITIGVNGFWVGKFETGYAGATTRKEAQINESASSKIIVKPNIYSWRANTIYNSFVSAYNYERTLDSHMMKNTEWGAVAYLSHSRYGIDKEININNNSEYKTGYSAYSSTDQSHNPGIYGDGGAYNAPYNTIVGYLASTTGNITGIYDMSGGAHEYMSSYSNNNLGESGFTEEIISSYNSKYFDVYSHDTETIMYKKRILGDATGEMGPFSSYIKEDSSEEKYSLWYTDSAYFIESTNPWMHRGGHHHSGIVAGQFYFSRGLGNESGLTGSRLVLVG